MTVAAISDLLQEGLALHRRGAVADAASRYAEVLRADPANADAHYYLAMIACQRGRFDEGAKLARKAVAGDPRHARAHVLLGRSLSALGRHEDALASFDCAIAIAPNLAQAHGNRGDVLGELGRNAAAVESYDRAVALAADSIADWFNRGVALAPIDRLDDALASFDRAIAGKPDYTQAHLWRAKVLLQLRRPGDALEGADKAVALEPGLAAAWLGRGHVLVALKRHDEALSAFDRALALDPDLDEAWLGCGHAALAAGKPEVAINATIRALELKGTPQSHAFFAQCARFAGFIAYTDRFRSLVLRALSEGWAWPRELSGVCISLIKLDGVMNDCIARANAGWPARSLAQELIESPAMTALSRDALLCRLIEYQPVADIGLERLLANVRCVMLTAGDERDEVNESLLGFYCSVARQCFVNDYVFSTTDAEDEQAQRLRASLETALAAGAPCPVFWPAVVGAYYPLHTLANAQALLGRAWPQPVEALIVQQVKEPAQERLIAAAMPVLTGIDDGVTRDVRQQYEESPYPRWVKAGPPAKPAVLNERRPDEIRDVLVAGCGTGPFAIAFARQAPQARILAIDLSVASLSYAKRMAEQFGLAHIEFAQADIMKLSSIGRQFDFIDASGVLHHLADPWQGWRALLKLLRPGGAMQVGLYSELARRNIVAARALIAERGHRADIDGIRRCREEIMAADDGSLVKSVTAWTDFYSTNECRDLLFHVREHRITLPAVKAFLAANDLQFAGFSLDAPILHRFAARFPEPDAVTDLDRWHAFEVEAPHTFAAMYQFAVRKPARN
jgi:tetratricopeptide (TPR) repeat protein/SAM-dependent methyltransferase